jgi:hypothetical protein
METGSDACTLLLCVSLRLTDGALFVLYVTLMVICFQTNYERTPTALVKGKY